MFLTSVHFWHNFNFIHIGVMFMLSITLLEPEKFLGANWDFELNHKEKCRCQTKVGIQPEVGALSFEIDNK